MSPASDDGTVMAKYLASLKFSPSFLKNLSSEPSAAKAGL